MNWLYTSLGDLASALNPIGWGRAAWIQGKRGWRQLLAKASPDARILLLTNFFWTVPLALTEPFKSLYLNRIGLDNLALGQVTGLDMALRAAGVLLGSWLGLKLGHRRVLVWGDFMSWVLSTLVLAMATQAWHLYVWAGLFSTNSLVNAPFQHLLLKETPQEGRAKAYGFMNVSGVLPLVIFSSLPGLLLKRFEFMNTMRILFLLQAATMAWGIYSRSRNLSAGIEVETEERKKTGIIDALSKLAAEMSGKPGLGPILGVWLLANIGGNLWRVYFGVYAVEHLHQSEAMLGYLSQAGSIAFVAASLWWLPRMSQGKMPGIFLATNIVGILPAIMIWLTPGTWGLYAQAVLGAANAAIHGALLGGLFAAILPQSSLAMGFALLVALLNLILGAAFPLAGLAYKENFTSFPISLIGLNLLQLAAAWMLVKGGGRKHFSGKEAA